jgi:hypothetical protein
MGHGVENSAMPFVGPAVVYHLQSNRLTVMLSRLRICKSREVCQRFGRLRIVYALGEIITDIRHDTYTLHFLMGVIDSLPDSLIVKSVG